MHTLQKYLWCVDPCPEWRAGCKSQHTKEIVIKRLAGRAGRCGQQTAASGQGQAVLGLLVSSLKFNVDDLPRPWRCRALAAAGAGIINMPPWLLWTLPHRQGQGRALVCSCPSHNVALKVWYFRASFQLMYVVKAIFGIISSIFLPKIKK